MTFLSRVLNGQIRYKTRITKDPKAISSTNLPSDIQIKRALTLSDRCIVPSLTQQGEVLQVSTLHNANDSGNAWCTYLIICNWVVTSCTPKALRMPLRSHAAQEPPGPKWLITTGANWHRRSVLHFQK
jgi:hypothetical protein